MSHINSIGAGMFSDMSVAFDAAGAAPPPSLTLPPAALETAFNALFATEIASVGGVGAVGTFVRIHNVRTFPAIGTPPNIVNVPTYGQSTSLQIQGQADAPSMEITLNYVATDWATTAKLGGLIGTGKQGTFRFALLNTPPPLWGSNATGLGQVENTIWYFVGKIDSLLVTPNLTDANQATIAITMNSKVYGAYTVAATAEDPVA
jgi:hypothetical protein